MLVFDDADSYFSYVAAYDDGSDVYSAFNGTYVVGGCARVPPMPDGWKHDDLDIV